MRRSTPLTAISATGLLKRFMEAGVLDLADVHVAQTLGRLARENDEEVLVAVALAVRALRTGSVCLDLAHAREVVLSDSVDESLLEAGAAPSQREVIEALPWPEPDQWQRRISASPLVSQGMAAAANERPVRLVDDLLYLERYWCEEALVRRQLDERARRPVPPVDEPRLARTLGQLFDGKGLAQGEEDHQRAAARAAATGWTTVLAGGPGTGKTTTVAKLLATLQAQTHTPLRVALAAPSGKASARLEQAVRDALSQLPRGVPRPSLEPAVTLHRLLESRGAGNGFGRGAANPLPHHVVVVDEMSMVALPMMARLLEALREDTRLVLVGDPYQLTSVDAGSVLADLVNASTLPQAPDRGRVVQLTHTWRFGEQIAALAEAIRVGEADLALRLLAEPDSAVHLTATPEDDPAALSPEALPEVGSRILSQGRAVHAAARAGDAAGALSALDSHRLLCAHREGRFGVARWGRLAEDLLRERIPGYGGEGEWYLGRPLLVTANLRDLDLSNGDAGVVVEHDGVARAVLGDRGAWRVFSPFLLDQVTSLHAMTVHKAQGSQFGEVTVVLPPAESALLTRELLYTAVTRASQRVHLVGSPDAVRRAIENPARRVSGLARGW